MNYITAIDPDLHKSGICTLNEKCEIQQITTMSIVELIEQVQEFPDDIYVIEDVNKIKAMYARGENTANTKIAQNVGMVKGAATIITSIVTAYAKKPPALAPVGIGKQVKKDAKLFNKLSGWNGKTNEDMRDAWAIAKWYSFEHVIKKVKGGQLVGYVKAEM